MSMHDETSEFGFAPYVTGFVLAVFFTCASFIPVMYGMLDSWAISTKVIYLIGMGLLQIAVHIIFFLHLTSGPDAKWNLSALYFTVVCIAVIIGGTWAAMSYLNYNMMGGSGRVVEPKRLEENRDIPVQQPMETQAPER